MVFDRSHPLARRDGYVFLHRKVVYDAGIAVPSDYDVHHKDGDRTNNLLENLEVINKGDHTRQHLAAQGFVRNQYGEWPLRRVPGGDA